MKIPLTKSLRSRLLAVLVGLTAIPVLVIGGLAYRNARQTVTDRVEAQLTSVADLKEEQITTWLEDRRADARLLADNFLNQEHFTEILDPSTDPERREAFTAFTTDNMISLEQARAGYEEVMFLDAAGKVILSTEPENVGRDLSAHPAVAGTLSSPTGEFILDIHQEADSGQIEMAFGHVLHAIDLETLEELPEVNGVVVIRVNMSETIYPLIRAWPGMGETGETLLVRKDGEFTLFLNPLRFDEQAALRFRLRADSPWARPAHLAAAGEEGIIQTADYRGIPVLAAYRTVPMVDWGFVAKEDLSEAFAPVNRLTYEWIYTTVSGLLAAVAVAVLLARTMTRPLDRLVQATRSVTEGNFETELPTNRDDEIGALTASFNAMITAIRQSHVELKTHSDFLESLYSLSKTLLATLEVDFTLQSALNQAMLTRKADAGAVFLADERSRELLIHTVVGLPPAVAGLRHPIDESTAPGYALIEKRPVATSDLDDEEAFGALSFIRELGVRSILAVPMLIGGRAIGAFVLYSIAPNHFSADRVRVTQAIANQTAIALERARLFDNLSQSYDRTLDALVAALDARDKETEGHSLRVVTYTLALARRMSLPQESLVTIRRGALLHDIGKIGIPDAILHKNGPLTEDEWAIMRRHPEWGEKILSGIQFLEEAAEIVIAHHERWDGKGYPRGLAGEAIPLGARTFAVADAFDAITSERPYRSARPYGVARAELIAGSGTQFDPRVVQAFLEIPEEEWREMRAQVQDPQRAPEPLPGWAGLLNALPTPGEEGADPNGKPGSGREETNRSALTGKRGS